MPTFHAPEEAQRLEAAEAQQHEYRGIVFFTGHRYTYGCREGHLSFWIHGTHPLTGQRRPYAIAGGSFYDEVHGDAHATCAAYVRKLIDETFEATP